jgi:hypothetical protein
MARVSLHDLDSPSTGARLLSSAADADART